MLASIKAHLMLSDNAAAAHQLKTLANWMPSMLQRVQQAYENTRAFVDHIQEVLPEVRSNFVSHELAEEQGFTPSVFSLGPALFG